MIYAKIKICDAELSICNLLETLEEKLQETNDEYEIEHLKEIISKIEDLEAEEWGVRSIVSKQEDKLTEILTKADEIAGEYL